jgi:hypothetical protein
MIIYTDRDKIPFQIDEDDWMIVRYYSWRIHHSGRPVTNTGRYGYQRSVFLHNLLLGKAPHGLEWDHENRDKLDNRRCNIRAVTRCVNARNRGLRKDNKSGLRGIRRAENGDWIATLRLLGTYHRLGTFALREDAIEARKTAEQMLWGSDT